MSVLDEIAKDAVEKAIQKVAERIVKDGTEYTAVDKCREIIQQQLKLLMEEPEIKARLRAKLIEVIDGLPASLPQERRR